MGCVLLILLDHSLSVLRVGMLKDECLHGWKEGEKKFLLSLTFCDQFNLNICNV